MTEIPGRNPSITRADVDKQVLQGLDFAYAANAAFNAAAATRQRMDQWVDDIIPGSNRVSQKTVFLRLLAEAGGNSDPLAKDDQRIKDYEDDFQNNVSEAGERIGRGILGSLFFHICTDPKNECGNPMRAMDYRPEYWEGVTYAHEANSARDEGRIGDFEKYDYEAGKRLGKETEAGILEDFLKNASRSIVPEEGESVGEAFDRTVIARASRCLSENDEERTHRIRQLQERVNTVRHAVAELDQEITYIEGWQTRADRWRQQRLQKEQKDRETKALNWFNENILFSDSPQIE